MPCNSDYLDQTGLERELQRTAKLYAYTLEALGLEVPPAVQKSAGAYYCKADFVPQLCALITRMSEIDKSRIIYDGRSKIARDLADWVEDHEKADRERRKQEAKQRAFEEQERRRFAARKSAAAKLTAKERRLLNL